MVKFQSNSMSHNPQIYAPTVCKSVLRNKKLCYILPLNTTEKIEYFNFHD